MKLLFRSIVDDEVINKELEYFIEDKNICFYDENIKTTFKDTSDGLICLREGKIKQELLFIPGKITRTNLKVEYNLETTLFIYTHLLKKSENGYYLKYDLILDNNVVSKHKIWIKYLAKEIKID